MRRTALTTFILECGHIQQHRYVPQVGELTYCTKCESEQRITYSSEIVLGCYHCSLNRKYGNTAEAVSALRAHQRQKPTHDCFTMTTQLALHTYPHVALSDTLEPVNLPR